MLYAKPIQINLTVVSIQKARPGEVAMQLASLFKHPKSASSFATLVL